MEIRHSRKMQRRDPELASCCMYPPTTSSTPSMTSAGQARARRQRRGPKELGNGAAKAIGKANGLRMLRLRGGRGRRRAEGEGIPQGGQRPLVPQGGCEEQDTSTTPGKRWEKRKLTVRIFEGNIRGHERSGAYSHPLCNILRCKQICGIRCI